MYRKLTVAAVVPAYNEEGFVGDVIDDIPPLVDRVYVIDDGSTDGTWQEIEAHARARNDGHDGRFDDLVRPIRHETNRGVGGAIKTGYERAREERIDVTVVLGGDDQMDPEGLSRYIDPIADGVADYAKGNRFAAPEDWAGMPRFRMVGNVVLSYLTKIASGYWTTMDSQNGYTAISLRALEETDIDGMYEYYGYCNDLLVRLNAAGMRVADVPRSSEYAYSDGWKSHIDYTEYVPRVSAMLLRSFLWRLRRKYLLAGYSPVAPLYLVGAAVTIVSALGFLRSLLRREDAGTWMLSTTVGVLTLLRASDLDRTENEHLETQIAEKPGDSRDQTDRDIESTVPEPGEAAGTAGGGRAADGRGTVGSLDPQSDADDGRSLPTSDGGAVRSSDGSAVSTSEEGTTDREPSDAESGGGE